MYSLFDLVELPQSFLYFLVALVAANTVLSYLFEKFFIGWYSRQWNQKQLKKRAAKQAEHISELDRKNSEGI